MRVALLPLLFVLPVLFTSVTAQPVGEAVSFTDERPCLAARTLAGGFSRIPGCMMAHEVTATLVACEPNRCTIDVSITSSAIGMPPGIRAVEASAALTPKTVFCAAEEAAAEGALSCTGEGTIVVTVPSSCRLFGIGTRVTSNGVVTDAFATTLRVCHEAATLDRV